MYDEYRIGMKDMKTMRLKKELSQEKLAEMAGTSQPQIGRLETGERPMTVRWAQKLAPLLGCKPLDLLPLLENEENLSKKPSVKDSVTKGQYVSPVDRLETVQEGKPVEIPDAVLAAIGRLTIEVESLKAELRKVKAPEGDAIPRKARGK